MEGLNEILEILRPLVRAKASANQTDKKIASYEAQIKELKKIKAGHEKVADNDEVIMEVEAWVDKLPKDVMPNSKMRELIKGLELLNK